jgi:hypothetical protein
MIFAWVPCLASVWLTDDVITGFPHVIRGLLRTHRLGIRHEITKIKVELGFSTQVSYIQALKAKWVSM